MGVDWCGESRELRTRRTHNAARHRARRTIRPDTARESVPGRETAIADASRRQCGRDAHVQEGELLVAKPCVSRAPPTRAVAPGLVPRLPALVDDQEVRRACQTCEKNLRTSDSLVAMVSVLFAAGPRARRFRTEFRFEARCRAFRRRRAARICKNHPR